KIHDDYDINTRPEHRLRVVTGMDEMLEDLREEFPPPPSLQEPRVVCIGGKWEIDTMAASMLVHALQLEEIPADERREGVITARYVRKLALDRIEVVCLSYFSQHPDSSIRAFTRRLNHLWPDIKIVLVLWN